MNKIWTEEDVRHIRSIYKPNSNISEIYKLYSHKIAMSGFRKICTGKISLNLLLNKIYKKKYLLIFVEEIRI